ncbi:DsbA family protein [Stutzerimonas nitrititolerans]|uniref:DsbA family protein n=1 Tax=Stutzerimonas nitrititolerans TaxID=2482751 RepID=A0AA41WJT5_9GAMM|nr:DsbA family protein [Stutzerimonas nitrititolerans]MCO7544788.1 DsbA family protein [Stutzerimonas nitrititolerans]SUD83988.1 protein-disulfide isomerase [Stutzerimonas stutzeri]HJE28571.1 DsbA family protein [Stutzerimonas nitrititolerans]
MTTRLIYVMDPMCSWCWGFAPVARALAAQAGEKGIEMQLVVGGLRRERMAMDAAGRQRTLGYWRAVHEASGQPFDLEAGLPDGLVYDTEPACRALVTARSFDEHLAWPLAMRIQQAFYTERCDVTRPQRLADLAEAVGLTRGEFADRFDSQAIRDATEADFQWARNLGIAGFPTLLAERHGQLALLTNGYQPLETLSPLLARWLEHNVHA